MTELKSSTETEICILGGGPAGAVLALRLAELGHQTVLVDRVLDTRGLRAESLAPSILPILDSVNLRAIVDDVVFLREKRGLLLWGTPSIEEKCFGGVPPMLVDRCRFDGLLREAAEYAGARVMAPAAARRPQQVLEGGWAVPVDTPEGSTVIKTRFLVDARGKRRRMGRGNAIPSTAAISADWIPDTCAFGETRIEAGADVWFWGSLLPNGHYAATIFLDSMSLARLTGEGRKDLYRSLLASSRLLADLLRGRMTGPVRVRDVTSGIATDLVAADFLRVGEAAFSIDPLSSQGIQAALISAIQASAAVHTLLAADGDRSAAIAFYSERQQRAAALARQNALRLYRAGNPHNGNAFWLCRSQSPERGPVMRQEPQATTELPRWLSPSPDLRIVDVPVLVEPFIARAPALSHPALEDPVAYLRDVSLVPLVREASKIPATDEILRLWARRMSPETAQNIMMWMYSVGILIPNRQPPPRSEWFGAVPEYPRSVSSVQPMSHK